MSKHRGKIMKVEVTEEFRVCPECGYEDGFHSSFIPQGEGKQLQLVLICPSCSARYDIGRTV